MHNDALIDISVCPKLYLAEHVMIRDNNLLSCNCIDDHRVLQVGIK